MPHIGDEKMVYVFTEEDMEWKFVVTADDYETAIKLISKELKTKGYSIKLQKEDEWRIDVFKAKKLVGTLGVAEYPFEMNQVY